MQTLPRSSVPNPPSAHRKEKNWDMTKLLEKVWNEDKRHWMCGLQLDSEFRPHSWLGAPAKERCRTCYCMCKGERWGTHIRAGFQTFLMSYNTCVTPVFWLFLPAGILKTPRMYPSSVVTWYSSLGYPWYLMISLCGKPKESLSTSIYSVEMGTEGGCFCPGMWRLTRMCQEDGWMW